jgi:hypothetical protein
VDSKYEPSRDPYDRDAPGRVDADGLFHDPFLPLASASSGEMRPNLLDAVGHFTTKKQTLDPSNTRLRWPGKGGQVGRAVALLNAGARTRQRVRRWRAGRRVGR